MSYTRTAIAAISIAILISAAVPGTQPAAASGGLAGSLPHRAHSHRPALQVPENPVDIVPATVAPTTITTDTAEQQEMAEWALEQMEAAGLELPPMDIHVHTDQSGCTTPSGRVHTGYYTVIDDRPIVHSCGTRWTLLHELAHAWDNHHLDDHTRSEILEHQGLTDWHADEWADSGSEHIASIVAWAIDGSHPTAIGYYDRGHLATAYEIATGAPVPTANDTTPTNTATPTTPTTNQPQPDKL